MPRKGLVFKREINNDLLYNSKIVNRLINMIMFDGKRNIASNIVYRAFDFIRKKEGDPLKVFEKAIKNIMPAIEVKARRVGGSNYQVPVEVRSARSITLGLRWLVKYSRLRNERTMELKLAKEIISAYKNMGSSIKKKEDTHKMAESNRAFAHYRW